MVHPSDYELKQMLKNFRFDFQSARTMPGRARK